MTKAKAVKSCVDCEGTGQCPCYRAERAARPNVYRAAWVFDCPAHKPFSRCPSCRGTGFRDASRVSLGETQPALAAMLEKVTASAPMAAFAAAWNNIPRRVEGDGRIRWFVNNELVCEVTTDAYYRDGHAHPEDCRCDALVHDNEFQVKLAERFRGKT